MTCSACTAQIGLRSAWRAHDRLGAPNAPGTAAYKGSGFQKLYMCSDCKTVLVKGRNTGWALATTIAAA